ncbi:MAG TPA: hypothetical protein VN397_04100 [Candidatus Methylomirabilis sp.]|nr:hypothetical protein [Candidatus Methylomirabilis sp.]
MNLLNIFPKAWMRGRKADELHALHEKLNAEYDRVTSEIQPLADGQELTHEKCLYLERLRNTRTQLGQLIEDLEAVICEKGAAFRAA